MGLTHLDAGVVIGLLDENDTHHERSVEAVRSALRDADHLAMATSAIAECLVGPARQGADAINAFEAAIARLPVSPRPIDIEVARRAALLRSTHPRLRLPDAFVIATAAADGADRLITTDRGWPAEAVRCDLVVI